MRLLFAHLNANIINTGNLVAIHGYYICNQIQPVYAQLVYVTTAKKFMETMAIYYHYAI